MQAPAGPQSAEVAQMVRSVVESQADLQPLPLYVVPLPFFAQHFWPAQSLGSSQPSGRPLVHAAYELSHVSSASGKRTQHTLPAGQDPPAARTQTTEPVPTVPNPEAGEPAEPAPLPAEPAPLRAEPAPLPAPPVTPLAPAPPLGVAASLLQPALKAINPTSTHRVPIMARLYHESRCALPAKQETRRPEFEPVRCSFAPRRRPVERAGSLSMA